MNDNSIIRQQFNKQANNFDVWSVTKNKKMLDGLIGFCKLSKDDDLLDVACGTGAFLIYAADRINSGYGVDISEGMIEIAANNLIGSQLQNIRFISQDVENMDLMDGSFSIVVQGPHSII